MWDTVPEWIRKKVEPFKRDVWLVGSRAYIHLLTGSSPQSDWDLLVDGFPDFSPLESEAIGTTYFGGLFFKSPGPGVPGDLDLWADDLDAYLREVPVPLWRAAIHLESGIVRTGPGFHEDLRNKRLNFSAPLPEGRIVSPIRLAFALGRNVGRYNLTLGSNVRQWLLLNPCKHAA